MVARAGVSSVTPVATPAEQVLWGSEDGTVRRGMAAPWQGSVA